GGGGDYFYSRGQFGYLVERRGTFEPPGFPPSEMAIAGPIRLDFWGLAVTGGASVVVLAGAGWLGARAGGGGRAGAPAEAGGPRGEAAEPAGATDARKAGRG